jgi:hypothetical protein
MNKKNYKILYRYILGDFCSAGIISHRTLSKTCMICSKAFVDRPNLKKNINVMQIGMHDMEHVPFKQLKNMFTQKKDSKREIPHIHIFR